MSSITIASNGSTSDRSKVDMVDIDQALQRGRNLRSQALYAALKSLFGGRRQRPARDHHKDGFAPDLAQAA